MCVVGGGGDLDTIGLVWVEEALVLVGVACHSALPEAHLCGGGSHVHSLRFAYTPGNVIPATQICLNCLGKAEWK